MAMDENDKMDEKEFVQYYNSMRDERTSRRAISIGDLQAWAEKGWITPPYAEEDETEIARILEENEDEEWKDKARPDGGSKKPTTSTSRYEDWEKAELHRTVDHLLPVWDNPDYQEELEKCRVDWRIPAGGFESFEEGYRWRAQLGGRSLQALQEGRFRESLAQIKARLKTGEISRHEANQEAEELEERFLPGGAWKTDLKRMARDFGLPENEWQTVANQVLYGKFCITMRPQCTFVAEYDRYGRIQGFNLQVPDDTPQDVMHEYMRRLHEFREEMGFKKSRRRRRCTKLARDRDSYMRHEKGETDSWIAGAQSKSEDEFFDEKTVERTKKGRQRYEELMGRKKSE